MNIEIAPGAALDGAKQIETIVAAITDAMDTLNKIITSKMGESGSGQPISTDWAGTVSNNWKQYYTTDIPNTMEEMKKSAANLRLAVENFNTYSAG